MYNLELISGNNQIGFQNTLLNKEIVVIVRDHDGNPVSNLALNIEVINGGGNVKSQLPITDVNGVARVNWILGSKYENSLEVSSGVADTKLVLNAKALYKYTTPQSGRDGLNVESIEVILNNPSKIYEAIDEIRKENYREIHSILLSVNSNLVFEEYFSGTNSFGEFINYDIDTPHELQSVNKSFRGAMIGIAIDKGYIADVNLALSSFFPDLNYLKEGGKKNILLKHLLNMTSGLEWNESTDLSGFYGTPFESAHTYVFEKELENAPGETFEYNTGTSFSLNRIIMNSISSSYEQFAKTNYSDLVESNELPGTGEPLGFRNRPRNMLKLGQVYLNDGKWKNTQVISKSWVDKSIESPINVSFNNNYGYHWWTREFKSTGGKTYDCFYASGFGGQYIFVIKELNLVAVFTAGNFNRDMIKPIEIMEKYILQAFE